MFFKEHSKISSPKISAVLPHCVNVVVVVGVYVPGFLGGINEELPAKYIYSYQGHSIYDGHLSCPLKASKQQYFG